MTETRIAGVVVSGVGQPRAAAGLQERSSVTSLGRPRSATSVRKQLAKSSRLEPGRASESDAGNRDGRRTRSPPTLGFSSARAASAAVDHVLQA